VLTIIWSRASFIHQPKTVKSQTLTSSAKLCSSTHFFRHSPPKSRRARRRRRAARRARWSASPASARGSGGQTGGPACTPTADPAHCPAAGPAAPQTSAAGRAASPPRCTPLRWAGAAPVASAGIVEPCLSAAAWATGTHLSEVLPEQQQQAVKLACVQHAVAQVEAQHAHGGREALQRRLQTAHARLKRQLTKALGWSATHRFSVHRRGDARVQADERRPAQLGRLQRPARQRSLLDPARAEDDSLGHSTAHVEAEGS